MMNLDLLWKRRAMLKCAFSFLGLLTTLTGIGESGEAPEQPIALDELVTVAGTSIIGSEFATRHPHLKIPRFQAMNIQGFARVARAEGRPITLFGLPAETASLNTKDRAPASFYVTFVDRGNGVRMPQAEFDQKLADITEAISKHAGSPPEEKADYKGPAQPGSTLTDLRLWRDRKIQLSYSRVIADASRQIPFRAEYITVRFLP